MTQKNHSFMVELKFIAKINCTLVTDVGDGSCWWQLWDVSDLFFHFKVNNIICASPSLRRKSVIDELCFKMFKLLNWPLRSSRVWLKTSKIFQIRRIFSTRNNPNFSKSGFVISSRNFIVQCQMSKINLPKMNLISRLFLNISIL